MNNQILQKLTINAKESLKKSISISHSYGSKKVKAKHLFLAILSQKGSLGRNILMQMGAQKLAKEKIIKQYESYSSNKNNFQNLPEKSFYSNNLDNFSQELKDILIRAFSLAGTAGFPFVGTEHLVYSLIENPRPSIKKLLDTFIPLRKSSQNLDYSLSQPKISPEQLAKIFNLPFSQNLINKPEGDLREDNLLEYFSINLNEKINSETDPVIGRKNELERIINILSRKNKNNPLLIGEPGVGKTAIVEKLAQEINEGNVPAHLLYKKIINLDLAAVVAGTTFRGEFENRLKKIIEEARKNKNIIIFIDEIHSLVGAGSSNGSLDAANILKPSLSRGEIQCIGATTFSEYKKYIEKDAALERRFQAIQIKEPSFSETLDILKGLSQKFENYHQISISQDILKEIIQLTQRYITERFLPDKAIDILDESAALLRNQQKNNSLKKLFQIKQQQRALSDTKNQLIIEEKYSQAIQLEKKEQELTKQIITLQKQLRHQKKKNPQLTLTEVSQTISRYTGVPTEKILSFHSTSLKGLQKKLEQKVIGQKKAIQKVTDILFHSQSGISSFQKPLGSFLFVGPTGVGKTFLAQTLAEEFFGFPQSLIRIDMSEFMERHNISRLVGAPAGYVGFEEGGRLTEQIRRQPYSLVLFDEIEKAHPDVSNLLLQILEEGFLTDASGRKIDFRNTIIILTSNLGTSEFNLANSIGFSSKNKVKEANLMAQKIKKDVLKKLKEHYRPELLNRLDHKIIFNPLDRNALKSITRLQLINLKKRLKEQNIVLDYDTNIINWITDKSTNPYEGARLIHKNIQRKIETPLAKAILDYKAKVNKLPLNKLIKIKLNKNQINFDIKKLKKQ